MQGWIQWHRQCTLEGCADDVRRGLMAQVANLFWRNVCRYLHLTNLPSPAPASLEADVIWHLFESRQQLRADRSGKRYKDWLFARAGGSRPLDPGYFESGVALLVRDTAIDFLTREFPPPAAVSLHAAAGWNRLDDDWWMDRTDSDNEGMTDVEKREYDALADAEAQNLIDNLSHRERIAVLARTVNRPLSDPAVLRAAGCGKSQLCKAFRDALERTAESVRSHHPREDSVALYHLTVQTFRRLRDRLESWVRPAMDGRERFGESAPARNGNRNPTREADHDGGVFYVAAGMDTSHVAE